MRALFFFIYIVTALQVQPIGGSRISRDTYINTYKDIAIRQMHAYGIPASIILAQACLESGDGNGRLAREANNHFGIKCHQWEGDRIYHDDDAQQECFRKYARAEDSFYDHSAFLKGGKRYQSLFSLGSQDYKAWAVGLKAAGYATNPKYAELLVNIIESYNLSRFDTMPLPDGSTPIAPAEVPDIDTQGLPYDAVYVVAMERTIHHCNGKRYVLAEPGDTYESLAREYDFFRRELVAFNDAPRHSEPAVGERVYLQPKAKKADRMVRQPDGTHTYVVRLGETWHSISQRLAVKEASLCKMNGLTPKDALQEGQILKVR